MSTAAFSEQPELLAPAGNWDCVRAAVANGADAVYFGLPRFNARLRADNFSEAELPEVVAFCHRHGVKAYVVFNTLVFTVELDDATEYLRLLNRSGVDALIVQDIGLVRLARALAPALPIHASTQMTVTSPEGAAFARDLGVERVVLARELSLRELEKFRAAEVPSTINHQPSTAPALEVFVHGALCVAYSGQCLTSESLGQRSANRGECAQACRMPYELIVDGVVRDLGDRRYLLSPQDLAAVGEIPDLLERGVVSFKIEGRLKTPEYVAAVCQVYRKAIDAAVEGRRSKVESDPAATPSTLDPRPSTSDLYQLEMTFSRGLFSGWMHGVDHQRLVPARSGKKRGPFAGRLAKVGRDHVEFDPEVALAPGDGIVFDTGGDTNAEQGGRIYEIRQRRFYFAHGHIDFTRLQPGDRVWKTDDPALGKRLRQSFSGRIEPRHRMPVDLCVSGRAGEALVIEVSNPTAFVDSARPADSINSGERGAVPLGGTGGSPVAPGGPPGASLRVSEAGDENTSLSGLATRGPVEAGRLDQRASRPFHPIVLHSARSLDAARTAPLTTEKLREHLGRFGDTPYALGTLTNALEGPVILPIAELNRLRRELIFALDGALKTERPETALTWRELLAGSAGRDGHPLSPAARIEPPVTVATDTLPQLRALVRTAEQLAAALETGVAEIYADYEDIRRYADAVAQVRAAGTGAQIFVATPRIQKAGEQGFFRLIENARPDGVLIRNLGAIGHFRANTALRKIGDFSLNVANPLTAQHFIDQGLERVTVSYDLNATQVLDLLAAAPAPWFELTLHQHMPMFHMEHCVFAAFLSKGSSFLDCGRPCDHHRVHLRDRVGMEHPLRADVGCRNTLFNAVPQTGARFFHDLTAAGLRDFRIELLEEDATAATKIIRAYQALLAGERTSDDLLRELKAQSQLGVTHGTLA